MDDDTTARLGRATAGASALGATALLVLSFGPSALAVTPSAPASPALRSAIAAPAPTAPGLTPRAADSDADADADDTVGDRSS